MKTWMGVATRSADILEDQVWRWYYVDELWY